MRYDRFVRLSFGDIMDHSSHETETSSQSDGHLDRELDAIVKIQRSLLPPIPSDTESVSFAVHYGPCTAPAAISTVFAKPAIIITRW